MTHSYDTFLSTSGFPSNLPLGDLLIPDDLPQISYHPNQIQLEIWCPISEHRKTIIILLLQEITPRSTIPDPSRFLAWGCSIVRVDIFRAIMDNLISETATSETRSTGIIYVRKLATH
jgi:hypothetical protein